MSWLVHVVDESAGWTVDTAMRLMTKPLREIVRLRGQSAKGLDGHAQSQSSVESGSFRIPPSGECLRPESLRHPEMSRHPIPSVLGQASASPFHLDPAARPEPSLVGRTLQPLHSAFGLGFRNLHRGAVSLCPLPFPIVDFELIVARNSHRPAIAPMLMMIKLGPEELPLPAVPSPSAIVREIIHAAGFLFDKRVPQSHEGRAECLSLERCAISTHPVLRGIDKGAGDQREQPETDDNCAIAHYRRSSRCSMRYRVVRYLVTV